jgi:hypothetical protein
MKPKMIVTMTMRISNETTVTGALTGVMNALG